MAQNAFIGKTLQEILDTNFFVARGFSGVSVFVKQPDEPLDKPGKRCAEDLNLGAVLKTHEEWRQAKVVDHNTFCGESGFRVGLPEP